MTKTLHSKTVPGHTSEDGIWFPEVVLYRFVDSDGVGGLLWHKTVEKAEESYQKSLACEPQRQKRREERARIAAMDAERKARRAEDPFYGLA
jgi:hypothetical protein